MPPTVQEKAPLHLGVKNMLGTVMAISFLAKRISAKFPTDLKLSGVKEKPEMATKVKGNEEKSSDVETGSEGKQRNNFCLSSTDLNFLSKYNLT